MSLALTQAGCGLFSIGSFSSESVPVDSSAIGSLDFPNRLIVNNSSSIEIEVECTGSSSEYLIINPQVNPKAGDLPQLTDSDWQTCPAVPTVVNSPVVAGANEIQIWFKSPIGLSPTPQVITAHRSAQYTFHLPESELGVDNRAAYNLVELTPTLFAVADPLNDVNGANSGSIHLINQAGVVQKTIRGSFAGDKFGSGGVFSNGIIKLSGDRFAVVSPHAASANGSVLEAGQVAVYDSSGNFVFKYEGDQANDRIGEWGVLNLTNGNLVVVSPQDDVDGLTDAGSVALLNGATGVVIGKIEGDVANDRIGKQGFGFGVRQLSSGIVLIPSPYDSIEGGAASVGSVAFMNPTTGAILSTIQGDDPNDSLGFDGVDTLSNGAVVIRSSSDDNPTYTNGGSVIFAYQGRAVLINGSTYAVIGTVLGSGVSAGFSEEGVIALSNGNFVVLSDNNEPTGLFGQGSATLVNGTTGAVLSHVVGDVFGGFQLRGIGLLNGNFVVVFPSYGASDEGRMYIVNGSTGAILNTVDGVVDGDFEGLSLSMQFSTALLSSGNFLIQLSQMDVGALVDAGCLRLYDGTTGALINQFCGDEANDRVGSSSGSSRVLSNGNILVGSSLEMESGVSVGRVRLINGTTGALIQSYAGATAGDKLGDFLLASDNGNAAIVAPDFDVGGIVNAGRVIVLNGTTGAIISTINGETAEDKIGGTFRSVSASGDFLLSSTVDDVDGKVDSGSVMLINKLTGEIKFVVGGPTAGDGIASGFFLSNGDYVLQAANSDSLGISNSGAYTLVPLD